MGDRRLWRWRVFLDRWALFWIETVPVARELRDAGIGNPEFDRRRHVREMTVHAVWRLPAVAFCVAHNVADRVARASLITGACH